MSVVFHSVKGALAAAIMLSIPRVEAPTALGPQKGELSAVAHRPLLLPSCRKLEFRLSALMDSNLAWVNGKRAR